MAESEEKKEAAQPAAPTGKSKKKLMLVVGGALLLIVGAGVPALYLLLGKKEVKMEDLPADIAEDEQDSKHGKLEGAGAEIEFGEGEEAIGAIVPFDTFLVNLSGGKYVRVQVQVEFESMDVPSRFYTRMVPIRDGIISALTQQTAEILEDGKGKERLKIAIKNLINDALREEQVRKVYFTQFVIQ
jgi:flagellar FliL protein